MSGRVVLITGASAGIGRAIAQRFAAAGDAIVAVARGRERLDWLEAELGLDTRIATLAIDAADPGAGDRAVALAIERFGRLDCLVNNAGAGRWGTIHQTDEEMLTEVVDLSLKAPFRFCRAALPVMASGGAVVNIGSTYGVVGGMNGGIYSAVKGGLVGLTRAVAIDYGPAGIRANLVAPGVIRTEMTEKYWDTVPFQRANQEMTPFNREGTVEDVADAVFFLAGATAGFINGQIIAVDGGWSATKYLAPQAFLR